MKRRSRYSLIMLVPMLVVLLNAWVVWYALAQLFTANHWLLHTLQVQTQAEDLNVGMSSANSTARAYLLTASPVFAERYKDAEQHIATGTDQLAKLTADNESQKQRIAVLRHRIAVKLQALDVAMTLRRGRPGSLISEEALRPVLADSPDGGVSVKYAITQVENEETRLLNDRYAEASYAKRKVQGGFLLATGLDLILLVAAFQQLANARASREELILRAEKISSLNAELSSLNAELEQRVEQRTRELEVSNQELQAFSYSVSHDLRAPLRTIDGFSLALAEDFSEALTPEGRDYIQRVRGGVQRMGTLIDALLQLSRVTRSEVQREPVDLSQLAITVFNDLMVNETGRDVAFSAEPNLLADADPRLMRVAFENLMGNALKFTSKTPGAAIRFGATRKDGGNIYFVQDNGAGFDMQYVDRLFTAFQRLHGDRDFKGSGIGLATVSRIIRRHHGNIWAEGTVGAGATFFFTLND